jgi:hypothetical protein
MYFGANAVCDEEVTDPETEALCEEPLPVELVRPTSSTSAVTMSMSYL